MNKTLYLCFVCGLPVYDMDYKKWPWAYKDYKPGTNEVIKARCFHGQT